MGIFSLEGMEQFQPDSHEYLQTAIERATSNSNLGYMAIDDRHQTGQYNIQHQDLPMLGVKSFNFKPGTKIAFILFPQGNRQPYSIANCYLSTSKQIRDLTGKNRIFGWEDLNSINGDGDYNDLVFEITRGVTRNF
jgi:Domain of unknown function (DUF4114)